MVEKKIEHTNDDIIKRLDVLIALQIRNEVKQDNNVKSKDLIVFLESVGLKYTEIAKIFGKSPSYIASEISLNKKRGKKK